MTFTKAIKERFALHVNPKDAKSMKAYLRDQFEFYGVKAKPRSELLKDTIRDVGLPSDSDFEAVVKDLWDAPQRELHYCAMELIHRKKWWKRKESIDLIEWTIIHKSWWDTVDYIAATLCGSYFKQFPDHIEPVIQRWNDSDNMWLVRSSILFQLKYKNSSDLDLLNQLIIPHLSSSEFFIQKAIGWSLRQVSKWNPEYVRTFVESHDLKPVSLREAKKYI